MKFILEKNNIAVYLQSQNDGRIIEIRDKKGSLAQLVQSTSFTPRGSGVRTPQLPLKKKAFHENERLSFLLEFWFIILTEQGLGIKGLKVGGVRTNNRGTVTDDTSECY